MKPIFCLSDYSTDTTTWHYGEKQARAAFDKARTALGKAVAAGETFRGHGIILSRYHSRLTPNALVLQLLNGNGGGWADEVVELENFYPK
jgi:hypothetical protein